MAFKVNNETKIGILATVALVLLIIGYNYLMGKDFFSSQNIFYAKYESVDGLMNANPVKIKGMNVGRVMDLTFDPEKNEVLVKFSVKSNIQIPKGTVARIISADILGSKAIELNYSDSKEFAKNGDYLPSDVQESLTKSVRSEVLPIKEKVESMLGSLDSVITTIKTVFTPETRNNIVASVKSIKSTLDNINESSGELNTILTKNTGRLEKIFENIESITSTIKNNEKSITDIMTNLSSITDSIKRSHISTIINNTSDVLARSRDVLDKINKGEGSLGLLLNDAKLYNDLDASSKNLSELLEDLKNNPSSYVHFSIFGGKDKKAKGQLQPQK